MNITQARTLSSFYQIFKQIVFTSEKILNNIGTTTTKVSIICKTITTQHCKSVKSMIITVIKLHYYSTIMSFYHIRSREGAKYEAVIHCSVLV